MYSDIKLYDNSQLLNQTALMPKSKVTNFNLLPKTS